MSVLRLHRIWRRWEGPPEPAVESSVVSVTRLPSEDVWGPGFPQGEGTG